MKPEEPRHDVLCGCGWGRLSMPESKIPYFCPLCGEPLPCWEPATGVGEDNDDDWNKD